MNFYYDTEFIEGTQRKTFFGIPVGKTKPTIDLVSIGVVAEDGREYYAISKEFNLKEAWDRYDKKPCCHIPEICMTRIQGYCSGYTKLFWIRENVLMPIYWELELIENEDYCNSTYGNYNNFSGDIKYRTFKRFKFLIEKYGKSNKQIAEDIFKFIHRDTIKRYDDKLSFHYEIVRSVYEQKLEVEPINLFGYYSAYDHVVFCWLYGKMNDLPDGFPMFTIDLKQMFDECVNSLQKNDFIEAFHRPDTLTFDEKIKIIKERLDYPVNLNDHNALSDARWTKQFHEFIKKLQ